MAVVKPYDNFDAWYIDDFVSCESMLRGASASFDIMPDDWWISYSSEGGQVGKCAPPDRFKYPPECLMIVDYIAMNFDPNKETGLTKNAFPDVSGYGGGMMLAPNKNNEGGFLGMHIDAEAHKFHPTWKREYSAVLGLSEEYDSSFDLRLYDGQEHCRLPYKFNRLCIFKCKENSWHGFPEITKGMDRKSIGLMYWSISDASQWPLSTKARFNNELDFS